MLNAKSVPPGDDEPTILLVEDDDAVRRLLRLILADRVYAVLEAHDAESAFDLAARHDGRIDLLITDVKLPGMGGRELAQHLQGSFADLKVLFVSGFVDDTQLHASLEPLRVELITKPFSIEEMSRRVAALLAEA